MRSASHTSFSVLGLCITFILGGSIILLEMTLEPVLGYFQRRRKTSSHLYQRLEWITNETLQLQRMAHEGIGAGNWIRTAETVPTTVTQENLAILDISEAEHPRLVYQKKEMPNPTSEERSSCTQLTQATPTEPPCCHQMSDDPSSSVSDGLNTAEWCETHDSLAAAREPQGAGEPSRWSEARTPTTPSSPQPTSLASPLSATPSLDVNSRPYHRPTTREDNQRIEI